MIVLLLLLLPEEDLQQLNEDGFLPLVQTRSLEGAGRLITADDPPRKLRDKVVRPWLDVGLGFHIHQVEEAANIVRL